MTAAPDQPDRTDPKPSSRADAPAPAECRSRVSLLGLGNMGEALTRTLVAAGATVTVWNRSPDRAAQFADSATVAPSAQACIEASELIVACLADYPVTLEVLSEPSTQAVLRGRTLVQLASGTPEQARDLAAWARSSGVEHLDGKIFTYPARIGDPASVIAYSGASFATYERHAFCLRALAGASTYVAEDPGAAAVLDLAWLSTLYGATVGLLQGVAFCQAHDVDVASMFPLVGSWLGEIDHEARYYQRLLAANAFDGDQATIDVHLAAAEHLLQTSQSHPALRTEFPAYLVDLLRSLSKRGMGDLEIAAAINAFRA